MSSSDENDRPDAYDHAGNHLGDKCFGVRECIATTAGVLRVEQVTIKEIVGGYEEKTLDSFYRAQCPDCGMEYESDEPTEDAREQTWNEAMDCCDAEWVPPSDWVEDCGICGGDHRGELGCRSLFDRDRSVDEDDEVACRECKSFEDTAKQTRRGRCPECNSGALEVLE